MAEELGTETGAGAGRINPGQLLHDERIRVGFTAEEVATHLRLSRATLGFLEAGRFDRLPGDTFARGYVRAYARLLKLDPNRLVQDYDRYVGVEKRESQVHTIDKVAPKRDARVVMTLTTVLVIVIMVSLGLWWWSVSREGPSPAAEIGAMDDVQVDAMALPDDFSNPTAEAIFEPDTATLAKDSVEPVAPVEPEMNVIEPDAADEPAAPAAPTASDDTSATTAELPSAAAPEAQAADGQGGLVMTFSDNCWVQVSVPGGRVLHSGQMQQGQTLNIAQQGPLDLVIGASAAVAKIEYNGQPVELRVNSQSGVARLRLGQ
ncbi:cytoskeleton protein RodZ [Halopseudomonas litoralis]|uniref:Cytoskeleton protein RodZ n=1 Tax=Halopseudomonas litoralis TaxID=797277 RepID=A0A1H1UJ76_9GAMM|nr:RodZ family helix-turn-helix domain-containing protein [Halopseudomonas litoralis]SDS72513.1 cytoskeleton protein RodZ [Halopseudomonas litoralis]